MTEFRAPPGTTLLWKVTITGGITHYVGSPTLKAIVDWYETEGGDIRSVELIDATIPVTVIHAATEEDDY